MAANPKFVKLLESLKEATSQGRVQWFETADEDTFRVLLDGAIVRVAKESDEEGHFLFYSAALVDSSGASIETAFSNDETLLLEPLLRELFEKSRRSARKVDDLLDRLISSVNARKP